MNEMGHQQDQRGPFQAAETRNGPSWLMVQVLAAAFGVTLIAAVLLPVAMGIRMKRNAEEAEAVSAALGAADERIELLQRENLELRDSGGRPELLAEAAALRRERDRLSAELEENRTTLDQREVGPDLDGDGVAPPLSEMLAEAGGVSIRTSLDPDAAAFGIAEGPLGFAMQQELLRLLPEVPIDPTAATVLEVGVRIWTWEGETDAGVVTLTLDLSQPWHRRDAASIRLVIWHDSYATGIERASAQSTTEQLMDYVLERFAEAVRAPTGP